MKIVSFLVPAALLGAFGLSGCNSSNTSSNSSKSGSGATQTLAILSPHTPAIQAEFGRLWNSKNPNTKLKWLDQGGTSDDLKFVREQFKSRSKEQGIGVDLFFGGGGETFSELEKDGLLVPLASDYGVPEKLAGAPLRGKDNVWVAAALSNFGILYNKQIAARDNLPTPKVWADLANPKLRDRVELADPRHSGSAHTIYEIILQTNGWDKGWKTLTAMAANSRSFAANSSAPLESVANGEAVFTTAIDFYAAKAIVGAKGKLAYVEPAGQTVTTADPIGILPGAQNKEAAKKFVDMVMSPEGQRLWFTPKGASGGPAEHDLYRLPALPSVYKNPPKNALRTVNVYQQKTVPYDSAKAAIRRRALDDLIGTVLVDNHDALKRAWKANPSVEAIGFVPISETEFMKLAPKWDDPTVANTQKDKWNAAARAKFSS